MHWCYICQLQCWRENWLRNTIIIQIFKNKIRKDVQIFIINLVGMSVFCVALLAFKFLYLSKFLYLVYLQMKNGSVYSNHSFLNGLTTFQKFIAYIFHTQILIIFSFRVSQEYNAQVPLFVMIDLIFLTSIFERDIPFFSLRGRQGPPPSGANAMGITILFFSCVGIKASPSAKMPWGITILN